MAGKVTAGLAESNGSLLPGLMTRHVCVALGLVGGDGGSPPLGSLLHAVYLRLWHVLLDCTLI